MKTKEEKIKKLEAKLKKLKEEPEFKVNDWVVYKLYNTLAYIDKINGPGQWKYEVTEINNGKEYRNVYSQGVKIEHATHERIELELIKRAKERGIDVGVEVKYKSSRGKVKSFKLITGFGQGSIVTKNYFTKHGIHLAIKYGYYISPVDQIEVVDELAFGGKKVKIEKDLIYCLGQKTTKENILELVKIINDLREWRFSTDCTNVKRIDFETDILQIGELTGKVSEVEKICKAIK